MDTTYKCEICCQPYDLEIRIPRILSACEHKLCEVCALEIIRGTGVQCPFCRKVTHVMDGNVKYLKKNFELEEKIYEILYKDNKNDDKEYEAERGLNIPCAENENNLAVFYCTKCEAHFCKRCSKSTHSSSKSLSSHEMIRVTEKQEPILFCPSHAYNKIEYYCQEEHCIAFRLMCSDCLHSGMHEGHQHTHVKVKFEQWLQQKLDQLAEVEDRITIANVEIESIGEIPDRTEDDQEYIKGKKEIDSIYDKNVEELNVWKVSKLEKLGKRNERRYGRTEKRKGSLYFKTGRVGTSGEEALKRDEARKCGIFDDLEINWKVMLILIKINFKLN